MHAVLQYIWHWLTAVNEHSLHSPFLFQLYTKTIKAKISADGFSAIEELRKNLISANENIVVENLGATSKVNNEVTRPIAAIAKRGLSTERVSKLLYKLIQDYKCQNAIELGTSFGINTLYMAANPLSRVFTFEGCPNTAAVALRNFKTLNKENIELIPGNIDDTLPKFLEENDFALDLAFVDANHQYQPTIRYFNLLSSKIHENSIIIIDDIYWSREMTKAWKSIKMHPKVTTSIDLFSVGIVLFNPELQKQHYRLMF